MIEDEVIVDTDAVRKLKIALEEEQRFHDEITVSFRGLRSKIVYFIGATLAVLTFLYAGALDGTKTMSERLFIPNELYGIIFYFFGLLSLIYALVVLVRGARPDARWSAATFDIDVLGDPNATEEDLLKQLVDDYRATSKDNAALHARKSDAIKDAFYPLMIGAIILVVLRFFQ